MRGCCLRLAGQHHLRPLMLSMSMSVIAKSKLSFVYHCLLLLHLPLFLCRTCSAAQRRPPAARSARRSPSHFLVLSSTLQSTRPSARGSSEACSGLATTEQTARSVCTPMLFCTFSFSSSRISSAARAWSLHRTEPSTSAPETTTLQQPLLSVLAGLLGVCVGFCYGGEAFWAVFCVPFWCCFSAFSFFFWFLLCAPFWWLGIAWVRADTRGLANALPCIGAATPLSIEPPSATSSSLLHGRRLRAAARC